jgi:hypothetical protein
MRFAHLHRLLLGHHASPRQMELNFKSSVAIRRFGRQ